MRAISIQLSVLFLIACDGLGGGDAGYDAGDPVLAARRREVVVNVAEVISADVSAFVTAAGTLEAATAAHATGGDATTLEAARTAWTDAMLIWEHLEAATLGPGAMSQFAGGMAIRDEIYSFPNVNTCRIDQEIVAQSYEDVDAFASEFVNVRGLGALEYLLFAPSAENTCAPDAVINTDGSWTALSDTEIASRRAVYAHTLAVLIERQAIRLRDAWGNADAGFFRELTTAGQGSALFSSAQLALGEIVGAMLYVDTLTKEMKVGEPAGIVLCTAGPACLVELESRWSRSSKEHALLNLREFQTLILGAPPGTDGPGFDDLLIDAGQAQLAEDFTASIAAAIASVEALEGTLEEAITNDPASVMAAYTALNDMLRLFKVDVITALDIEVRVVPTDND